jgi:hypothetical protein
MDAVYYAAANAGSFGGVKKLSTAYGATAKTTRDYLSAQDAYTLHKPIRRKFPRRKTFALGIDDLWQADLCDMQEMASVNDGNKYLLTIVDVFSKMAFVKVLKTKSGVSIRDAFAEVFRTRKPTYLQTDKGTEFKNVTFQKLLKENNVKFYTSENDDIKCAVVERFNRTLKTRMWRFFTRANTRRYVDVLDDLVSSYNSSYHRSIKMSPAEVCEQNLYQVRENLFPKRQAVTRYVFNVGDKVRISHTAKTFKKAYLSGWSEEVFVISSRFPTVPETYSITDVGGEEVRGKFYRQELQKVQKDDYGLFKVDKVLKTRKRLGQLEYFVSWLGYPSKFNSWVEHLEPI